MTIRKINLYFQKAGTTNSLATELQEDPFFYFIKLYFSLYIKPNAIEEHMREIIDLITLT
jgi:hypothetical protein